MDGVPRAGGIRIRRAAPDEWAVARAVRLRALMLEPDCFGGSLATDAALTEIAWRQEVTQSCWFLATHHAAAFPVGLAVFYENDTYPDGAPQLGAMWVEPSWRRGGVAARLVAAVEREARRAGAQVLGLWVTDGNDTAVEVYERLGYVSTSWRKPAPRGGTVMMRRMTRDLVVAPASELP